jgi:branched-chain amino acid transport system substrate-binding protein
MHGRRRTIGIIAVLAALAAGCGSSAKSSTPPTTASGGSVTTAGGTSGNTASAPGVSRDTIKVGFITSETGVSASSTGDAVLGAKGYFDAVNAAGGVDGRRIQMVVADDQSSPTGNATATQDLLGKGVFLIVNFSAFTFGGYRATQQAGVPVIGGGYDGPEWGKQPNTNMFAYLGGSDGRTSNNLVIANFFKLVGANNIGGLAYGISPSSTESIQDLKLALQMTGLSMGYENLSVPFGGVDLTSQVLAMKSAGVNGAVCSCVQSTDVALFTGLKQAGVTAKAVSLSSADSSLFDNPTAAAAAQGAYYPASIPPLDQNNPASNTFVANVKAADPSYKGGYPSFGLTNAYLAAVLTVKGLQVAGQNPTRASFIKNLTAVTNWNANGLLASPVSFNHFGTSEPMRCEWFVQVSGNTFKSINNGQPVCGKSF